jgi:mono/diheme cytochrome c family protein
MNALKLVFSAAICLLAAGCYYDSQEFLYNNTNPKPCDTTNITYSGTISKIIANNCSACHGASTGQANGIFLDTFTGLQQQVANGKLMGDINQNQGYNAMPLGGNKLDPCSIAQIQHWIDLKTPNN